MQNRAKFTNLTACTSLSWVIPNNKLNWKWLVKLGSLNNCFTKWISNLKNLSRRPINITLAGFFCSNSWHPIEWTMALKGLTHVSAYLKLCWTLLLESSGERYGRHDRHRRPLLRLRTHVDGLCWEMRVFLL